MLAPGWEDDHHLSVRSPGVHLTGGRRSFYRSTGGPRPPFSTRPEPAGPYELPRTDGYGTATGVRRPAERAGPRRPDADKSGGSLRTGLIGAAFIRYGLDQSRRSCLLRGAASTVPGPLLLVGSDPIGSKRSWHACRSADRRR